MRPLPIGMSADSFFGRLINIERGQLMKRNDIVGAAMLTALATASTEARATISVGGFTFPDNGFVDTLLASTGSYTVSGGSLASVLTDTDPNTFAFSFDTGASLTLGWSSVRAVNGPGDDIVLFELGTPDSWNVTINGTTRVETSAATGFSAGGFDLLAAPLDLSDFGVASGGSISQIFLTFNVDAANGTVPSTALVGALETTGSSMSTPEPSTWAMMLIGFASLGYAGYRARRTATSMV
jgi:PEP-CTERM motif